MSEISSEEKKIFPKGQGSELDIPRNQSINNPDSQKRPMSVPAGKQQKNLRPVTFQ